MRETIFRESRNLNLRGETVSESQKDPDTGDNRHLPRSEAGQA